MTARRWFRSAPLSAAASQVAETWEYRRDGVATARFEVDVLVGKALDVAALKGTRLDATREYAELLAGAARRLYSGRLVTLADCPICSGSLHQAATELAVLGVPYVRCPCCGHVLVRERPPADAFDDIFAESEAHSSVYVDRDAVAVRMAQVVAPKLEWTLAQYARHHQDRPRRVIDVGAGGGHFLAGARRDGLHGEGFERSRASRRFAREAFGLTLREDDFLTSDVAAADVVTMWGLLEYVAEPRTFLRRARTLMSARGMLIVEVPRVDALGTRVQAVERAVVARHMDPTSHINAFSDASLCTALVEEGFAPVAAWYFGMDGWETLTQAALLLDDESAIGKLAALLPALQASADRGRQCDDIVVAALPAGTA